MRNYLSLMNKTLLDGEYVMDRTGTGTYSIFGEQLKFDLRKGFPLVTTKKIHWKSVVYELLWFITGSTNTKYLKDNGVTIWDEWATKQGELGPIYGYQWRYADGIDQLANAIDDIRFDPHSRRIIVDSWNTRYIPYESLSPQANALQGDMALAPCHMMYQFYVSGDEKYLDLQMYQRSVDTFLGLPFNIASYALLLSMVAQVTEKIPRNFIWIGGDIHLYSNHLKQAGEQLKRKPYKLPRLRLNKQIKDIDDFTFDDIQLLNYKAHPHIKAPISV